MSGIAGIIHFDGRPVEPGQIEAVTAAMHYRGPDGINHWRKGNVALGQCMLCTTPESLEENQPLTTEDESLVLVMDGRVDNVEELRRELLGRGAALRTRADAELVLRAYEVWGGDCLLHIDGDYALAIWDAQHQEMFCARDRLGIKPFFYYMEGGVLSFASDLQGLLGLPWLERSFNIGMISEYLADSLMSRDETFFQKCLRLPAASILQVSSSQRSIRRYWDPSVVEELHLRTEDQYVELFADLISKATSHRMRTISKIGVLLSGGLDSSAVASFAQSASKTGAVNNFGIETFSLVFPGLSCDERPTIDSFLARTGLNGFKIDANQPDLERWSQVQRHFQDIPDSPTGAAYYSLFRMASGRGCRVMLGGWGSDDWVGGGPHFYADLISRGGLCAVKSRLQQDTQQRGVGNAIRLMLNYGVRPLFRHGILNATRLRRLSFRRSCPPWMGEAMVDVFIARRELAMLNNDRKLGSFHKEALLRWLNSGMFAVNAEIQERICAWHGLEGRYPFNDRSIVDFFFALPDSVKWKLSRPKQLLVKAVSKRFPLLRDHQFSDPSGSQIYLNAVSSKNIGEVVGSMSIGKFGWIDSSEYSKIYRKVIEWSIHGDERWESYVRSVWQVAALELWCRMLRFKEKIDAIHS